MDKWYKYEKHIIVQILEEIKDPEKAKLLRGKIAL